MTVQLELEGRIAQQEHNATVRNKKLCLKTIHV